MKFGTIVKRLSHPQVRRRLKIGLSIWGIAIVQSVILKITYDIGYFNAQSLEDNKKSEVSIPTQVLTPAIAQRIVSGALMEDAGNPKTLVTQIIDNNQKLSTIIIENNKQRRIAWIIDMRLFFAGDLLNDQGYNLTESIGYQHNIAANKREQ